MFLQYAGTTRYVYNWGLERKIEEYQKNGKSLSAYDLMGKLIALKHGDPVFAWLSVVSSRVSQNALLNLERAFSGFFRRIKNKEKPGFPRFKSKNRGVGGFKLNLNVTATASKIKLPNIGWVRFKQKNYMPKGKYKSAAITEHARHWFVSVLVECEPAAVSNGGTAVGVDVGINHLAVTSEGQVFDNPKAYKCFQRKIRKQNKSLSRKQNGSHNRKKAKSILAKTYYRIFCIRKDALHKVTTALAKNHSQIAIENLNVQGMVKNHRLAGSIMDAAWGEFRRQLEYKCRWYGSELVVVDRFFPSSKTCSCCGHKKESLALGEREFTCEMCGMILDRDLNAAKNLLVAARKAETVNACGEEPAQAASMKQESGGGESLISPVLTRSSLALARE
jgi:putative transposase